MSTRALLGYPRHGARLVTRARVRGSSGLQGVSRHDLRLLAVFNATADIPELEVFLGSKCGGLPFSGVPLHTEAEA